MRYALILVLLLFSTSFATQQTWEVYTGGTAPGSTTPVNIKNALRATMNHHSAATAPSYYEKGYIFFDTDTNLWYGYDGTSWKAFCFLSPTGDFMPASDNTYDIGSTGYYWATSYITVMYGEYLYADSWYSQSGGTPTAPEGLIVGSGKDVTMQGGDVTGVGSVDASGTVTGSTISDGAGGSLSGGVLSVEATEPLTCNDDASDAALGVKFVSSGADRDVYLYFYGYGDTHGVRSASFRFDSDDLSIYAYDMRITYLRATSMFLTNNISCNTASDLNIDLSNNSYGFNFRDASDSTIFSLDSSGNGTFSGAVQGASVTDGTATLSSGSITSAVNGTFSDDVTCDDGNIDELRNEAGTGPTHAPLGFVIDAASSPGQTSTTSAGLLWMDSNDSTMKYFDGSDWISWGTGSGGSSSVTTDPLEIESIQVATPATKTSTYTITTADYMVCPDASSNDVTINLPAASTCGGQVFVIKAIDVTNNVYVDPNGTDTIDESAATMEITTKYYSYNLISNGTDGWWLH